MLHDIPSLESTSVNTSTSDSMKIASCQSVAEAILAQLGGNRFIAMTGAKEFVAIETGLRFKLPRGTAQNGINCVEIRLSGDEYAVHFLKLHRSPTQDPAKIQVRDQVQAEELQAAFQRATGLHTRL
jgi:hypothetical protein